MTNNEYAHVLDAIDLLDLVPERELKAQIESRTKQRICDVANCFAPGSSDKGRKFSPDKDTGALLHLCWLHAEEIFPDYDSSRLTFYGKEKQSDVVEELYERKKASGWTIGRFRKE